MRRGGGGLCGVPILQALLFVFLQQRLAGGVALIQCLQQRLRTVIQVAAGMLQRLLLALDKFTVQCLLLFGSSAPGLGVAAGIGLQALADACHQGFTLRALAFAEGLQMLAQFGNQRLLRAGLLGHYLGPARFGRHAAALEALGQTIQLLLHGLFDTRMQRLAVAGQAGQGGFGHRLQRAANGRSTGFGPLAQRLLQRGGQAFLQRLALRQELGLTGQQALIGGRAVLFEGAGHRLQAIDQRRQRRRLRLQQAQRLGTLPGL